ncbi:hypothetical protein KNO15_19305 [Leifsonia shinshuensis]|uniref:hypothetical protein n=1 Tax=Leifsonia shinshuensis TaxID=150026 RepID=UPI001F50D91B|nr:hypothetical protein [Leifsonia shinshuensis]MCI0158854.1 hypothetical protein [Leifsonia shinshuensis]
MSAEEHSRRSPHGSGLGGEDADEPSTAPASRASLGVPPTPEAPVASFYRYPSPHEHFWLYYDGGTWVGEPRTLPWYRRPMAWARGRAPVGSLVVLLVVVAIGVSVYVATR